ncbi:AsmA family protein [Candidatus Nitrotoga fabula]|uniref:AsmA family protein n=1 Tax=Candidatus Nitrotoga fabula TaxID=2182327 RepID=A0A916BCI1_9PROT|nr:AsmA family protein [Candidatus Nitrotoga fabula]CAE6719592.1 AsmA family protein [Candidatus Nitrotoga fabula]
MKPLLKYSLWSAGVAIALVVAAIIYITTTFDPNNFKTHIIQLVKEKQQRTLKLDDDIRLVLFPQAGIEINKASLSEFQQDRQFMYIENARISLALLPLLSKKIIIDEIYLKGLKINLIQFKNGKTNIDDLLNLIRSDDKQSSPDFEIGSLNIQESQLSFFNEKTDGHYLLSKLNCSTSRITNNSPIKINYSSVIDSTKPKLKFVAQITSTLTFDLLKNSIQIAETTLHATGTAFEAGNLEIFAKGKAHANFEKQKFSTNDLTVTVSGEYNKNGFNAKLDMPELNLTQNTFMADRTTLTTRINGPPGKIDTHLTMLDLFGNFQFFKGSTLQMKLDWESPGQVMKLTLDSPVICSPVQQLFSLPKLKIAANVAGNLIPEKSINARLNGKMQADGLHQVLQANFKGDIQHSQFKTAFAINGFQNPAIRFAMEIDQLDANLYLPRDTAGKSTTTTEKTFDLSAMKNLKLDGKVRIGSLGIANTQLSQVRLDIQAANGQLNIIPLPANSNNIPIN